MIFSRSNIFHHNSHAIPRRPIDFFSLFAIVISGTKNSILTKNPKTTTFSRVFHPNFFLTIFLVKWKLSTAKKNQNRNIFTSYSTQKIDNFLGKPKLLTVKKLETTTFSRVFHKKKIKTPTFFSGNQSWIYGQKMKISNRNRVQHTWFHKCTLCQTYQRPRVTV